MKKRKIKLQFIKILKLRFLALNSVMRMESTRGHHAAGQTAGPSLRSSRQMKAGRKEQVPPDSMPSTCEERQQCPTGTGPAAGPHWQGRTRCEGATGSCVWVRDTPSLTVEGPTVHTVVKTHGAARATQTDFTDESGTSRLTFRAWKRKPKSGYVYGHLFLVCDDINPNPLKSESGF